MTDATTAAIVAASRRVTAVNVPVATLADARLRIVDTLGCLAGGWDAPPARIAQRLAAAQSGTPSARVLGTDIVSSVQAAAFANSTATRYLDFNDTYMGVTAGHPSDMIPALLAVAEAQNRSGIELLVSVVAGYEAFGVIAKELSIRARGWDQGLLVGIGTAIGAASLLGLDEEQTRQALALTVTMGVPTRATRAGALAMWKGAATAASARAALFGVELAAAGMTGPDQPIEGKDGLWSQATGPFQVRPFGPPDPWMVSSTAIKFYPAEFNAQSAIELVVQVRAEVDVTAVERIDVWTYWSSYDEIGNEPAKWAPETRETADHSMPYLVAVALREGSVTESSFDTAHLADPTTRELMARIAVHEDPSFTAAWPELLPTRVRITMTDGTWVERASDHSRGHPRSRPAAADVERKFLGLTTAVLGRENADHALQVLAGLESAPDVAGLVDCFVPRKGAPPWEI